MIEKRYNWAFEIAGRNACFTRPDTGAVPISYPAPTRSALIGIAESVALFKNAYFWPERVEICSPIVYHKYVQNYNGPLREKAGPFQLVITVLENVDYKVYGSIKSYDKPTHEVNYAHEMQDMFLRNLEKGRFFSTPHLGLSEMIPAYFGPLRSDTVPDESINLMIPSMLDTMYDRQTGGRLSPKFQQNVRIEKGVLRYAE